MLGHVMIGLNRDLQRRRVFQATATYGVAAFVVAELAGIALPSLGASAGLLTAVVALLVAGLPVTVVLSWFFDLTADGVVRTPPEPPASREEGLAAAASIDRWLAMPGGVYRALDVPPEGAPASGCWGEAGGGDPPGRGRAERARVA